MENSRKTLVHTQTYIISALLAVFVLLFPYATQGAIMTPADSETLTPQRANVPQATITFTPSTRPDVNASIWPTGSNQQIQWVCSSCPNGVNVTLWRYTNAWSQVATISTGITTGQTTWHVPIIYDWGNYELRLVSAADARVQARKTVTVRIANITIQTPKAGEQLVLGGTYPVTWTYDGNPGPVKLSVVKRINGTDKESYEYWYDLSKDYSHTNPTFYPLFKLRSLAFGQATADLTLPEFPFWPAPMPNEVISFRIDIRREMTSDVHNYSYDFGIRCPKNYCVKDGKHWCCDFQTSQTDCGACGYDCRKIVVGKSNAIGCVNGRCQCIGIICKGLTGNYCSDLKTDKYNCGACGHVCGNPDPTANHCGDFCRDNTCYFNPGPYIGPHAHGGCMP